MHYPLHEVKLGDYFTGGPVILTLNYYSCPMLCPLIFRNLSNTIAAVKGLSPGKEYRIVTVSIDPDETTARARAKADETWRMLPGIAAPERNWPFLLDKAPAIERLAATVGLRYAQLGKNNFACHSLDGTVKVGPTLMGLYGHKVELADGTTLTADTALRLARFFGTDAQSWMNLQAEYDLEMAEITLAKRIAQEVKPLKEAA